MNMTPLESWISGKTGISGRPCADLLRGYQLGKLRENLGYVLEHSRFYRRHLNGYDPDAIKTIEDAARLPMTSASDIAANPNDFLCVSPREIERIVTLSTSGTTGSPKRIFFTEDDQELTVDFFHHGMTTLTSVGDRVLICMPGNTEGSVGDLLKKGLSRFGCEGVVYGPIRDYGDALTVLAREKIAGIVGIPSQILSLSRMPGAGSIMLKSVLLSADYVPAAASASIEDAWGSKVYGHYGMTEMGLGGGVECDCRDGYHLREADILFEVIDPLSGMPVPDGVYGEVVFSTLTRRGMPLIRYRTGDRARFLTEACPCQTVLRRLSRVTGRIYEAVRLTSGATLSISELDEVVLTDRAVSSYTAALRTVNNMDCLCLTVRVSDRSFDREQLALRLRLSLPHVFGPDLALEITEGDIGFFTTGTSKRRIDDERQK